MTFEQMKYVRTDYDGYKARAEKLFEEFEGAASAEEQLKIVKGIFALQDEYLTMTTLCMIRHTVNTADQFYSDENDYYDENSPKFEALQIRFFKLLLASRFKDTLEKELGNLLYRNADIAVKSFDERLIDDMAEENRLKTRYTKLIASAQIEFDGKKVNLSGLGFYMNSYERDIRRRAYAARSDFFLEHGEELDEIYDKLVKVRDKMAKAIGCKNYVELGYLRMTRNSYDAEQVKNFRDAVKAKIVPLAQELYKKQRERLDVDTLMFYDVGTVFKDGNPLPIGTPEEIFENGKKMYHEMSAETGEFIDFMLQNGLFDVLGRDNKAAGGYCTLIPDYRAPFIFANFNGTHDDIGVLTHEAGHAFEFYTARNIYPPTYRETTADAAEIHSMSMEFFCWPWTKLFFGEKADKFHYLHLAESVTFIPYGCLVDHFQHEVYEHPEMTPAERKECWHKLEKEYMPHLNYGDDPYFGKGGTWQRQLHIYEYPFYYIDYCLAQTCALQFWSKSLADRKAAWADYVKLCRLGGTKAFTGLVEEAGLLNPFTPEALDHIASTARQWFDSFDESKL